MRQIAEAAKVSRPVVSAVLSGSSQTTGVSAETAERVRRIAVELGYTKQWRSTVLRDGRTHLVGLLGTQNEITKHHNLDLLAGLSDGLERLGMALTLAQTGAAHEELIKDGRFDGCFIDFVVQPEQIEALHSVGLPGVIINAEPREGVPAVRVDEDGAMQSALSHLRELGHRRIGFINNLPESPKAQAWSTALVARRASAWRKAGGDTLGPTLDVPSYFHQRSEEAAIHSGLMDLLRRPAPDRPTALVCYNASLAFVVAQSAESLGLSYPRDLSIISMSNDRLLELLRTPISCVAEDFYRVGRVGAERLLELIDRRSTPEAQAVGGAGEDILVPSVLHPRRSTAAPLSSR